MLERRDVRLPRAEPVWRRRLRVTADRELHLEQPARDHFGFIDIDRQFVAAAAERECLCRLGRLGDAGLAVEHRRQSLLSQPHLVGQSAYRIEHGVAGPGGEMMERPLEILAKSRKTVGLFWHGWLPVKSTSG